MEKSNCIRYAECHFLESLSEEVACGKGFEDANDNSREENGAKNGLEKDCILDLAKSRLLNPNFTIQDLTEYIALLVLDDPGFILIAIVTSKRVE